MQEVESSEVVIAKYVWVILAIIVVALGVLAFFIFNKSYCGDETIYGKCSSVKPYFCLQGELVERASLCGCPENFSEVGEECFSEYKNGQKNISLVYFFDGEKGEIEFVSYGEFYNYTSRLSRFLELNEDGVSRRDFKLRVIDDELHRKMLMPLVVNIQNLALEREDQAEIAISLVQNIPYESPSNISLFKQAVSLRYPYEVLYENKGICGEKSDLLAFLLKELGFGVSIFYFPEVNHEAVGIKCAFYKDFRGTGYCFIETTEPSKVNEDNVLKSLKDVEFFEIIEISDGEKF